MHNIAYHFRRLELRLRRDNAISVAAAAAAEEATAKAMNTDH